MHTTKYEKCTVRDHVESETKQNMHAWLVFRAFYVRLAYTDNDHIYRDMAMQRN